MRKMLFLGLAVAAAFAYADGQKCDCAIMGGVIDQTKCRCAETGACDCIEVVSCTTNWNGHITTRIKVKDGVKDGRIVTRHELTAMLPAEMEHRRKKHMQDRFEKLPEPIKEKIRARIAERRRMLEERKKQEIAHNEE